MTASSRSDHPFDCNAEGMHAEAYQMLTSAILWRAAVDLMICLRESSCARADWQRVAFFWMVFDPLSFWDSPWSDTLASAVGDAAEHLRASILSAARSCEFLPVSLWLDLSRPIPPLSHRERAAHLFLIRLSRAFPRLLQYATQDSTLLARPGERDIDSADSEVGGVARDAYVLASRLQRMARKEKLSPSTFLAVVDQATRWAVAYALQTGAPSVLQIRIARPPRVLHLWHVDEPMPFRFRTERPSAPLSM